MKNLLLLLIILGALTACEKDYICDCAYEPNPPHKKIYIKAKTDGGAERQCNKNEEAGETCVLQ